MKRNAKHIIFVLLFILTLLSVSGCSKVSESKKVLIHCNENYEVGIRIGSFETSGRLSLQENAVKFLHTCERSSLFGMEEILEEKHYTANFHDICWECYDTFPATHIIYKVLDAIIEEDVQKTEFTTLKNRDAIQYSFSNDGGSFSLYMDKETEKPIKIAGVQRNTSFEINFTV